MHARPKPINQQTIVITGASSGIGLATAKEAARRGARLVLASRSGEDLAAVADELRSMGAEVETVEADVASEEDVRRIARIAVSRFGGFDTWVNNAVVSIYGRTDEVPTAEARRLFDINFWGVVNGSREALDHLRRKETGGAIINVGSVASDSVLPLQSYYSASKHAVKGFTDALRIECEKERLPVNITLIKPTTIDTPFFSHAASHLRAGEAPKGPDPAYAPELVADAILFAAEHPRRDIVVGGAGRLLSALGKFAPRAMDAYGRAVGFRQQRTRKRPRRTAPEGAIYEPGRGHMIRGGHPGWVRETSLYSRISEHPLAAALIVGAAGVAVAAAIGGAGAAVGRRTPRRRREVADAGNRRRIAEALNRREFAEAPRRPSPDRSSWCH